MPTLETGNFHMLSLKSRRLFISNKSKLILFSLIFSPVLVPRQVPHILLGRLVAVRVLYAHRPHSRVGDLRGGHRELDVTIRRQLLGNLIETGQRHATDHLVCSVRALAVLRQAGTTPDNRPVVVFVLCLARGHFDQGLLEIVDGS